MTEHRHFLLPCSQGVGALCQSLNALAAQGFTALAIMAQPVPVQGPSQANGRGALLLGQPQTEVVWVVILRREVPEPTEAPHAD